MTSQNPTSKTMQAAYDIVGKYTQDNINGFDEDFLNSFVKLLNLENANNVMQWAEMETLPVERSTTV